MVNKDELDELEKWNTQRVINEKEKSKFYYEKFNKNKKIEKFTKCLNITGIVLRIIAHIIVLIAIIIALGFLCARISSMM